MFFDASGLSKRYAPEDGTETINALLAATAGMKKICTVVGYAEIYAILLRRKNADVISLHDFRLARASLEFELIQSGRFELLNIEGSTIFSSLALIDRHNLNSTDAAVLATFLQHRNALPAHNNVCVLVASDKRLLRAATAEGLPVLDPESLAATDVIGFLNAL